MFFSFLRSSAARLALVLTVGCILNAPIAAQVALPSGTSTQSFDSIAGGLPAGWSIYTGATASTLGTSAALTTTAVTWSNTSGGWRNVAAADNTGFVGTETDVVQAAATDRALGIRQTGTFGDPGASANFNFSTIGVQVSSISFSAQMLSVQTRSTVWQLQYGVGASPATWTTIGTFIDPGVFGKTTVTGSGFGTALDNQSNVWLRIVTLAATTGSGSRDTFGIDDFTIVTTSGGGGAIAPSITTQPVAQSVTEGATATFTVVAAGTPTLLYQWQKGGVALADGGIVSGATTNTMTLTGVTNADAGSYSVVVSNGVAPNATSDAVTLTVVVPTSDSVLYWNFNPIEGVATPTSGLPGDVTDGKVTQGNNNGTTELLTTISASSGYTGFSGSYNAGAAARIGSFSPASSVYFEFTLKPAFTKQLSATAISFGSRSTGTGPQSFAVYTSVDGFAAPVASGALANNGTWALQTPTFASVTGGTGAAVTFRIYGFGGAGSPSAGTANWRIDDLKLNISTAVGPPVVPAITATTPINGAAGITDLAPIIVTFNQPVIATGTWFTLTGSLSGVHTAVVSGGPTSYTLTPDVPFSEGETVTLVVLAAQIVDESTGTLHPASDYTGTFAIISTSPIHTVQGSALTSTYAAQTVRVRGIVTATFQAAGQIGGYYIEAPDAEQDSDPMTSEGIYVFDNANSVTVGDFVTVTGTLVEYGAAPNSETEISPVTSFTKDSTGNPLPSAVAVSLPFAAADYAERYEGMLVTLPQTLTVTDTFSLGKFGELRLSNGRLPAPTNVVAPGAPAIAQEAANLLNQVILDDGVSTLYPSPTPYLNGGDVVTATRRSGDTATGVTGIFGNKFSAYVVEPTIAPVFVDANPRSSAPNPGGTLHVAIGNVLNCFNGDGAGGGFATSPDDRGANSLIEYERQRAKIIAGILGAAPDIMGLTDVENDRVTNGATDSYGPTSAIADIVNSLNAVTVPKGITYAFVNAAAVDIVTDQIHCAFIYRVETVAPVGAPAMLNSQYFNSLARNPLAQTFKQISTGEKLTVCINHFKSKGSASTSVASTDGIVPNPNLDTGDGQGQSNYLRKRQAEVLTQWLATDPTASGDPDFLIIGDLNAYAKEDPIVAIESAGFINLTEASEGPGGYSYTFDGEFGHLDHALANPHLAAQVTGAATWHVNSDEPIYYDYNLEHKNDAQAAINVGTPYRYSDHDPVVIGVNLTSPPAITVQPIAQTTTVGVSVTFTVTATGTPTPTYQWRKGGIDILGATGASFTISNPVVADSGEYDVVVTNALDSVTSAPFTLTVNQAPATVTLGSLEQRYDGTPREATATTDPVGLPVDFTYDGLATAPIYPGAYAVVGTIDHLDYFGSATDTLVITTTVLVRHAPAISGGLDGSLQMVLPESLALNGSAWISSDLLVTGTPTVVLNGSPTYAGTLDAAGSASPSNYSITLNSGAVLRHVVRRVTAVAWPTVSAPPLPVGTRSVTLTSAGQTAGDFATVLNLTLSSKAGQVTVPAGTYGTLTANKNTGFTFGVAGAVTPAIYNLQGLTLNSGSQLEVVGPVIITLANGLSVGGTLGSAAHPEWLEVKIASGGLTLMGNVNGSVIAPNGTVTVNGNTTLTGSVTSDRLTINHNGLLQDSEP